MNNHKQSRLLTYFNLNHQVTAVNRTTKETQNINNTITTVSHPTVDISTSAYYLLQKNISDKTIRSSICYCTLQDDKNATFSEKQVIVAPTVTDLEKVQNNSVHLTIATNNQPNKISLPGQTEEGITTYSRNRGFFTRLKTSLVNTRKNLGAGLISLFQEKKIDSGFFELLEEQLLVADIGFETTRKLIASLAANVARHHLIDTNTLYSQLRLEMASILANVERPLNITSTNPFVILIIGVNGVGKTTTIGKLAHQYRSEGKSVMLAAGDTFRAAAVEQLKVWGDRNHLQVVAQQTGADSASVIFNALQLAKASGIDVLIADTAGRLHNKAHLMTELKKIVRVMNKLNVDTPHEIMLIIDASNGQNAMNQVNLFNDVVGITGITLTKLDGTAKGGVIFSVAEQFGIPIRYIGLGEGIDDLRSFNADDFIEAILPSMRLKTDD